MVKALRSRLLWAGWVLLLAGCGGGGSGEDAQRQPSVFVAQTEFRYERVGDDTARIEETVSIRLTHLPQDGLFVSHGAVPAFLSRLHFEQPSSTQALLHFRVEAARELDPGLHTGELQLHFCRDEACEQPIAGSPVVLSFSYLVTPPPVQHYPEPEEPADPFARLTPLQLYPLAYEVVDSAFSSAMSSVLLLAAEAEPGLVAYGADGAELTRYTLDRPAQRIRLSNDGTLVLVQSGLSLLQVVALQQANGTVLMSPVRQVDLGGFDALDDLAIADDGTLYAVGVRNDSPAALYWLPADETSWHRAEQQVQRSMLWLHPDGLTLYLMSTPGLATGHYSLWSLDRDQGPQWQGVGEDDLADCGPLHPLGPVEGRFQSICGDTLETNADGALVYAGTLRHPRYRAALFDNTMWHSVASAGGGARVLGIQGSAAACVAAEEAACRWVLSIFSAEALGLWGDYLLTDRVVGGENLPQHPVAAYPLAEPGQVMLLTRAVGEQSEAYALAILDVDAAPRALPFEPDPGPYRTPRTHPELDALVVDERQFLAHNVVAARGLPARGLIALLSDYPQHALYLYDVMSLDSVTVPLDKQPLGLALSPDQDVLLVGHDGRMTTVALDTVADNPAAATRVFPFPGVVAELAADRFDQIHLSETLRQSDPVTWSVSTGELMASDRALIGAGWQLDATPPLRLVHAFRYPDQLVHFEVSATGLQYLGQQALETVGAAALRMLRLTGRDDWLLDDGGHFVLSDPVTGQWARQGALPLTLGGSSEAHLVSVAPWVSEEQWLTLESEWISCEPGRRQVEMCLHRLAIHDTDRHVRLASGALAPITIDGKPYTQLGVLAVADPSVTGGAVLVSRLYGSAPRTARYQISRVRLPESAR